MVGIGRCTDRQQQQIFLPPIQHHICPCVALILIRFAIMLLLGNPGSSWNAYCFTYVYRKCVLHSNKLQLKIIWIFFRILQLRKNLQVVGTGFLALFVASIIDKRNKIPAWTHPLLFGLGVLLIGTCYGMNVGYPINPARDFGPRIFTLFIYGTEVFT